MKAVGLHTEGTHVKVIVQKDILRLEVSMHDLEPMAIVYAGDELLKEAARFILLHSAVGDDVVEELSSDVFKDDDDVCSSVDDLVPSVE